MINTNPIGKKPSVCKVSREKAKPRQIVRAHQSTSCRSGKKKAISASSPVASSLEDVLVQRFGCEHPFSSVLVLNNAGEKAYQELVTLLFDIGRLTETESEVDKIVRKLDDLADGTAY